MFTTGKIVHLEGQARFTERFMGYVHVKTKTKNLFFPRLKSLALNSPYIKKGPQAILMLTYEFEAV